MLKNRRSKDVMKKCRYGTPPLSDEARDDVTCLVESLTDDPETRDQAISGLLGALEMELFRVYTQGRRDQFYKTVEEYRRFAPSLDKDIEP